MMEKSRNTVFEFSQESSGALIPLSNRHIHSEDGAIARVVASCINALRLACWIKVRRPYCQNRGYQSPEITQSRRVIEFRVRSTLTVAHTKLDQL